MQSQKQQNDLFSSPRQTIQYYSNSIYALKSKAEEVEVEWLYEDLQDLLELTPPKDVFFIIGDWHAKVGSQEIPEVTGKFHLGVQNEAKAKANRVLPRKCLVIANTLFQQHKRQLYTWTSPNGQWSMEIRLIVFFAAEDG